MNKETYVGFNTFKLLEKNGFDWEIPVKYYQQHNNDDDTSEAYYTCTQQMACRWLREEHEIDIIPIIRHSLKYAQESPFRDYACRVYDRDGNIVMSATKWYSRYENAVEAALQYALKNLI